MPIVGCAVHRVAVVAGVAERTVTELGVHDSDENCHNEMFAEMMSLPANADVAKFRNDLAVCDPLYPARSSVEPDWSVVTSDWTQVSKFAFVVPEM